MGKVIEKIKNLFKCRAKKPVQPAAEEEPKPQQEEPKPEEKSEEQK